MPRRIALLASIALLAAGGAANAKPVDDACQSASPNASVCLGAQKVAEAKSAVCRSTPAPNDACASLITRHDVSTPALADYQASSLHRAAQLHYALGATVPLRDAQWLGTH